MLDKMKPYSHLDNVLGQVNVCIIVEEYQANRGEETKDQHNFIVCAFVCTLSLCVHVRTRKWRPEANAGSFLPPLSHSTLFLRQSLSLYSLFVEVAVHCFSYSGKSASPRDVSVSVPCHQHWVTVGITRGGCHVLIFIWVPGI